MHWAVEQVANRARGFLPDSAGMAEGLPYVAARCHHPQYNDSGRETQVWGRPRSPLVVMRVEARRRYLQFGMICRSASRRSPCKPLRAIPQIRGRWAELCAKGCCDTVREDGVGLSRQSLSPMGNRRLISGCSDECFGHVECQ